jgi:hypothetical protein
MKAKVNNLAIRLVSMAGEKMGRKRREGFGERFESLKEKCRDWVLLHNFKEPKKYS